MNAVCLVGRDPFDTQLPQTPAQRIAVVSLVGDQPLRFLACATTVVAVWDEDRGEGDFSELDFRRRDRSQVLSQRKALAIDHHHPLCTLAPLGFADSGAPFFAEAKLPSINASLQSSCPFRFNSSRKVRQIVSQTPRCSQSCRRRQQVAGDGYSPGRSCHLVPLRAIHRIPSNIDVKVFDFACKCDGFIKQVDSHAPEYKTFKKVMDKRNDTVHGNISPEKEPLEIIYFEKRRPLFKEPGDHLAKYFDSLSRRYDVDTVSADCENVHLSFAYVASLLRPDVRSGFWKLMESRLPGYDVNRKIAGVLLPEHTATGAMPGTRYDDELNAGKPA